MFNKKNFIILVIIINMIISVCISINAFAGINMAVFMSAAATTDSSGNIWVYVGTGDKTDPSATTGQERVLAIKDNDRTTTYKLSNLMDISSTSAVFNPASTVYHGWYITLGGAGEKMLSAPVIYDQKLYFTTYTPNTIPCNQNGSAKLYIIDYLTGAGLISGSRSETVGYGIPSGPVISVNPYGGKYNVYVSTSAANYGTGTNTTEASDPTTQNQKLKYMIYWKDQRVQ
jgi:Tfp pilus tip-associated adhesin PilY1